MSGWVSGFTAILTAALAVPAAPGAPAQPAVPAARPVAVPSVPPAPNGVATVPGGAAGPGTPSAASRPCPYHAVPSIPPTPAPPPRERSGPVLGGDALAGAGLAAPAGSPAPPAVSAVTWVIADLDSGDVLAACGAHERRRPASVQKLLLAATAVAKLDPAQVVEATPEDLALPGDSSLVGMVVGGRYPVATLWCGLLMQSGNDTANALARVAGGAGGVAATVAAMNAEAARLGAEDTHAANPHGLDAPDQFTSAYDLALIARAAFANPDFVRYDTTARLQWPPAPPRDPTGFQIQNENQLLTGYPGALGGKTGFTDEARHTYVGAAQRDGRRLVVTLMGAENIPGRTWKQASMLLDWAFAQPAGGAVGHLVTSEEMVALRTPPTPTRAPAAGAAGPGPLGGAGWRPHLVVLALTVALLIAAITPALVRRLRRR